jgi:hypothetical protein
VPLVVFEFAIVGSAVVAQHTPLAVIAPPPSAVIFPPEVAVVIKTAVTAVVVRVGTATGEVVNVT